MKISTETYIDVRVDCNYCGSVLKIIRVTEDQDHCNIIDVLPCDCRLSWEEREIK